MLGLTGVTAEQQIDAILGAIGDHRTIADVPRDVVATFEGYARFGRFQDAAASLERWIASTEGSRRQERAERFRKIARGHRSARVGIRRAQPAWQRAWGAHLPRSIEAARQDPRVRGQIATLP